MVERDKALEVAMTQIEKQFGKGAVMKMGERPNMQLESIPTGALSLDIALGIGGLPRGRIVEIFGPESSGKSTLAMHVVAEAQRNGGICAYVDAEHAMDPAYAKAIGVNVDELLISQPDTGEQALEIADMLIRSGALDVIVIDSVAALTPRAEIEGEMGDAHVGLQARLMSQALRKLTATLSRSNTIAIFINQLREKVGIVYGSPEITPGGRALKFYSSIRLDIRRIESIKNGAEVIGNRTRVKVVKNKCLAAGTMVFDPSTGTTHRIEDVVESGEGGAVVAADKSGKLLARRIVTRFDQGEAEVIGLGLRDGMTLWVTPDHEVLTDRGWQEAGNLTVGDRVARPRRYGQFGTDEPVTPDQARMLGYLIGDGYLEDPPVERDELLALCHWAGIDSHLAPTKLVPAAFFADDISSEVVANLLFGLFESDGWVSREQTGSVRVGWTTTSEQLANQVHWLLLRWGIGSSVRCYDPAAKSRSIIGGRRVQGKLLVWEIRVSGLDNVQRFAEAIPMWGPRGRVLAEELTKLGPGRRGSQRGYLAANQTNPVLAYLDDMGVTPRLAARLIGDVDSDHEGGLRRVLGHRRLLRDRIERLADALDSEFLREILGEDVWYDQVKVIHTAQWRNVYDVEVDEEHTLVANDVVVHNCAPPFRVSEFDIMFGHGISREGSLIDVAVDLGMIKKSGAWYTYNGEQLGQGRENAKTFLSENLEVMIEISEKIRQTVGLDGSTPSTPAPKLGFDASDDEPISLD